MTDSDDTSSETSRRTCWRSEQAGRVSFLVDGEAYFAAVADAIERAKRSVLIAGWDINSRVKLRRPADPTDSGSGEGTNDASRTGSLDDGDHSHASAGSGHSRRDGRSHETLRELLNRVTRKRRRLHVNILCWDFAMMYALEREMLPLYRLGWQTHRRVHFRLDSEHPVGASHHQKIVVVDDAIAFIGGLDLTAARWDTREHHLDEPRRRDPWGRAYPPFHDVQIAFDGAAASAAAELVRMRWRHATHKQLDPVRVRSDPWPRSLEPDLRDVEIQLARTQPAWNGTREAREIEALYIEAIGAARKTIYIENQFLTSASIGDALAERLAEADGPEVIYIGPRRRAGWLEELTMGTLRARLLERLREADTNNHLRSYYAMTGDGEGQAVNVHSKVMVIDDTHVHVGSANLNNRSMGLDTELDAAIDAGERDDVRASILAFRDGLVAEHLGVSTDDVRAAIDEHGGLGAAIEALRREEGRTLKILTGAEYDTSLIPPQLLVDPEHPVSAEELLEQIAPRELPEITRGPWPRIAAGVAAVAVLALAWRYGPLATWFEPQAVAELGRSLQASPWGPIVAVVGFVLATLVMAPITALIMAMALVFGPLVGALCSFAAGLASAIAGYAIGRTLWRDAVRRLAGERLDKISHGFTRGGWAAIAAVRLVPVAPYNVVNLVAGASHMPVWPYVIGTAVALVPGTIGLSLLAAGARIAVVAPDPSRLAVITGVAIAFILSGRLLARRLRRKTE